MNILILTGKFGYGHNSAALSIKEKLEIENSEEPLRQAEEEEEIQIPNISTDNNRMLSPDEIAALVAGVSQTEPETEEETVESPLSITDSETDAKKMEETADESETEEEPVEIHVSEDSNRQLTPEEIAALFASI